MRIVNANRVQETTTTTGTGTLTLGGAVAGFQTFAAVGDGNRCHACVFAVDANGIPTGDWEVFLGTYTASGTTLSRDVVIASSNADAAVTLAAGTKRVILTLPAGFAVDTGMGGVAQGDVRPTTAGTYDEEFEGTADALPTNWTWASAPSGSDATFVNSRRPSMLTVEGTADGSYTLTRGSFAPGTGAFGVWARVFNGPAVGSNKCDFRMYVKNSGGTEGRCIEIYQPTANGSSVRALQTVTSSETAWSSAVTISPNMTSLYVGLTRSAANLWTAWYSANGIGWQFLSPQATHSFTVAKVEFKLETATIQSLSGLDWFRYRADTEFPRVA